MKTGNYHARKIKRIFFILIIYLLTIINHSFIIIIQVDPQLSTQVCYRKRCTIGFFLCFHRFETINE